MYGYCGCLCNFFSRFCNRTKADFLFVIRLSRMIYINTSSIISFWWQSKRKAKEKKKSHTPKLTLGRVAIYYAIAP